MPAIGGDLQRGGWYDVMERKLDEGQTYHRYAWHDRKAWWQQEQGILAYLILDGILDEPRVQEAGARVRGVLQRLLPGP